MIPVLLTMVALSALAVVMARGLMSFSRVRIMRNVHLRRVIGACAFLLILFPGVVRAHGTVTLEEDRCVQRVGGSLVHFNAYQPQHEATAQYCTEIPGEGDTFLVVDLVDPSLRNRAVAVRVVRGLNESADEQTVAYWPPAIHADGVVSGEARLVKGLYTVIITPEGFSPSSYFLRVQQIDYTTMARKTIGPITLLLLFVVLGYELSKSTRWRNWRVLGPS